MFYKILRTDGAGECFFRASAGTNFENISTQHQPVEIYVEFMYQSTQKN